MVPSKTRFESHLYRQAFGRTYKAFYVLLLKKVNQFTNQPKEQLLPSIAGDPGAQGLREPTSETDLDGELRLSDTVSPASPLTLTPHHTLNARDGDCMSPVWKMRELWPRARICSRGRISSEPMLRPSTLHTLPNFAFK